MSTEKVAKHGREHCPTGSDPIPCLVAPVLDWVQWACSANDIPVSDGSGEPNFWGQKWGEGAVILNQSSSTGFSVASQSLTDASGTSNRDVLRLPAGYYLVTANVEISNLYGNYWGRRARARHLELHERDPTRACRRDLV